MNLRNLTKGTKLKIIITAIAMLVAAAIVPAPAGATLPAPNWLPGQPMLAGTQIIAMWLPVPGAVKYNIYLNGEKILESAANQYIGAAPDGAGEFKFEVTAIDGTGAESPRSKPGVITITMIEPPAAPIFRPSTDGTVTLRWNRPTGAVIFNVYRSETPEGPFQMLSSVQEEAYKDTGLEAGKTYYYSISAKDITGKESEKGEQAVVEMKAAAQAVSVKNYDLKVLPSQKISQVSSIGDWYFENITYLNKGPDGRFYGLEQTPVIHVFTKDLVLVQRIFVTKPEALKHDLKLYYMDFVDEETAAVTDIANGMLHLVDLNRGAIEWSTKLRKPTKGEDEATYNAMLERFRTRDASPMAVGVISTGGFLISDVAGAIMHQLDDNGDYVSWSAFYQVEGPAGLETKRLANVNSMKGLSDGTVIVGTPLGRVVLRLNPENYMSNYIIGNASTMVGNFIGVRGIFAEEGSPLLVADGTMHTVQGFDLDTGEYLFSIGDQTNRPDPNQNTRPSIDFNAPMHPVILDNERMIMWLGLEKEIMIRRFMEPPPAKGGAPAQ